MYKKGYTLTSITGTVYTLLKQDFAGDRSFTSAAFSQMLARIRAVPAEAYPLVLTDLDLDTSPPIAFQNRREFYYWFAEDYA